MAYNRSNPVSAIGRRAYDLAVMQNSRRGKDFTRNYDRVMRVAASMQQRYNDASKGNSNS